MTTFSRDSLSDQIERGELFLAYSVGLLDFDTSGNPVSDVTLISVGANPVSCLIGLQVAPTEMIVSSLYEDCTVSANGTSIDVANMNRDSANTIATTVYQGPTTTVIGPLIAKTYIYGSNPENAGALNKDIGFILKPNTKYLLATAAGGNSGILLQTSLFLREI